MNARSCLWTWPLVLASTTLAQSPLQFQELVNIDRITYDNRALKPMSVSALMKAFRALPTGRLTAAVDQYVHFVNKVLIIRNVEIVDNPDFQHDPEHPLQTPGRWTFPSLLTIPYQKLGFTGSVEAAVQAWTPQLSLSPFNKRWLDSDKERSLPTIPLRLLAVVNRLDLARSGSEGCPTNMFCKAEVRFVYAGTTEQSPPGNDLSHPFFTLILEFVLPPLASDALRDLVTRWVELNTEEDPNAHRAALECLLNRSFELWSSSLQVARIRVNSRASAQGLWTFGQFLLTKSGFQMSPLDQQFADGLDNKCVVPNSSMGQFLIQPQVQAKVLAAAADYNFFAPPGKCPTGDSLATCYPSMTFSGLTVLTLDKKVAPGAHSVDDLRYALSINSCTGCHGLETQGVGHDASNPLDPYTHFDQIKYREVGEQSRLSRFLAGVPGGEPSLPNSFGWTVNPTPTVSGCGPAATPRTFNDLLRRALFHVFVLIKVPPFWIPISANGLAALQSH